MKYYPESINAKEKKFESITEIKNSIASGEILSGRVLLCDKEHNLHLDLGIMPAMIPRQEGALGIEDGTVRDIALISKVNKLISYKIIGIRYDEYGSPYALLSRRIVQLECMRDYVSRLKQGDIITSSVTHLENFGAFIDIGAGINSLIPIDMLSVSRISHPNQRLYDGQIIQTVLRKIEDNKLTFSLKELLGTWEENANRYSSGETVTGIVRSIESYGVFIELAPNLAGLAEPYSGLKEGQKVSVYIKSILPEKMKIKLVIVEAFDDFSQDYKLKYYIKDNHISHWNYSPNSAIKDIHTYF